MNNPIYIFSGLGADSRVFAKLDFGKYTPIHIDWIPPFANESMSAYALRISASITTENPIIMGLSFGGMIAVELAKQIKTSKVILISSAKGKFEVPYYYRWLGKIRFHYLLPSKLLKFPNRFTYWFFGIQTKEEKALLNIILKETDAKFLKWALNCIVTWKNEAILENVCHIHGSNDHVLPIKFVHCDHKITNGGHFALFSKSDEVSRLIQTELAQIVSTGI